MTNPERPAVSSETVSDEMQEIIDWAAKKFGPDALFTFPRPSDRQLVTMDLAGAMIICGEHIVRSDRTKLEEDLGKWNAASQIMESRYEKKFTASKALAETALQVRLNKLGGESGESI